MAIISLQIQVTESGAVKISTISQDLSKLGQTAADSSSGMIKLNDTIAKGSISGREMSTAVGAISEAFGVANPAMSQGLIHLTRFIDAAKQGSTASMITAGAVLGIGTAIAATMAIFEKTEDVAKRFAEIQRASDSLDLTKITSELTKTTVELQTQSRVWDSWSGAAITSVKQMLYTLVGIPSDVEVSLQAMERLRAALERALPFANQAEAAKHSGTMADLTMSGIQTYTQNLLATGQLPLGSEAAYATTMQTLIEQERQAAIGVANATRLQEFSENSATGAADIIDPSTQKRYDDAVAEINTKAQNQLESLNGTVTKLGQAIVTSNANIMGIELKFVASTGDAWRGGEELKRSLMEQTTAWTANETDKRIDDVDRWERAALDKIREKEGFTRDSEGLEEQIVATASARRIQIYQEEGAKVRNAIQGQVDPFEEAAKLQLNTVTVTQQGMLDSYNNYFTQIAGLYANDTGGYIAEIEQKKVELEQQLLAGTISEQTYYTVLTRLRDTEDQQYNKQISTQLAAHGIMIDQKIKADADYYNQAEKIRQINLTNLATYYLAVSAKDDDYWAGIKSGMVSAYAQLGTFWQDWAKGWETAILASRDLLSTGFFDIEKGKFSDLGDAVSKFGDTILQTFNKVLADSITRQFLGLFDLGISSGGGLVSLGTTATATAASAAGGAAGGGGGALGTVSSGGSLIGGAVQLYNWLTGGTAAAASPTTIAGIVAANNAAALSLGGTGAASATAENVAFLMGGAGATGAGETGAIGAGMTAAASDLGLPAVGGAATATGATAAAAAPLAAWLGPIAAIGAPLMAILMNNDQSDALNASLTAQIRSLYAADPSLLTNILANPLSDAAWNAVNLGGSSTGPTINALDAMDQASRDTVMSELVSAGVMPAGTSEWAVPYMYNAWENPPSYNAEGFSGYTTGPTTMITGEAGTEHVTVIKNPRQVDLDAAAGQGGGDTYNLNITIHAEGSLADPASLAEFVRNKIKPELVNLDRLRHGPGWSR